MKMDDINVSYPKTEQDIYPDKKEEPIGIDPNYVFKDEIVSVKDWLITYLILCVPIVNIIMMFIWAFSEKEKKSKANYFKAQLIFSAIMIGLSIIGGIIMFLLFASLASSLTIR